MSAPFASFESLDKFNTYTKSLQYLTLRRTKCHDGEIVYLINCDNVDVPVSCVTYNEIMGLMQNYNKDRVKFH